MNVESASLAVRLAVLIDGERRASPLPVDVSANDISQHLVTPTVHVLEHPEAESSVLPVAARSAGWTMQFLEQFVQCLLSDPSIVTTQHSGVTRARVRALLPDHLKVHDEHMLQWLHTARVLAPPVTHTALFRHPRQISCTSASGLIERLVATPYPVKEDAASF